GVENHPKLMVIPVACHHGIVLLVQAGPVVRPFFQRGTSVRLFAGQHLIGVGPHQAAVDPGSFPWICHPAHLLRLPPLLCTGSPHPDSSSILPPRRRRPARKSLSA